MNAALLSLGAALALLAWSQGLMRAAFERLLRKALGTGPAHTARAGLGLLAVVVVSAVAVPAGHLLARLHTPWPQRGAWPARRAVPALFAGEALGGLLAAGIVLATDRPETFQLMIIAGVALMLGGGGTRAAPVGKCLLGAALAMLSIALIALAGDQVAGSPLAKALASGAAAELPLAAAAGLMLCLLMRSVLVVVVLAAGLTAGQWLPPDAAFAIMLGANLGSGLYALAAARAASAPVHRAARMHLGLKTLVALVLALALAADLGAATSAAAPSAAALRLALWHGLLNLMATLLALGLAVQRRPEADDDASADAQGKAIALRGLMHDVLHQAYCAETVLRELLQAALDRDAALARPWTDVDEEPVTAPLGKALVGTAVAGATKLKQSLLALRRMALSSPETLRWKELMAFALALEQVLEIAERTLRELNGHRPEERCFPRGALAEICGLHAVLMFNLRSALSLLQQADTALARALAASDASFIELRRLYAATHHERLAAGEPGSLASGAVYLGLLDALERMNTQVCALGRFQLQLRENSEDRAASAHRNPRPPQPAVETAHQSISS